MNITVARTPMSGVVVVVVVAFVEAVHTGVVGVDVVTHIQSTIIIEVHVTVQIGGVTVRFGELVTVGVGVDEPDKYCSVNVVVVLNALVAALASNENIVKDLVPA